MNLNEAQINPELTNSQVREAIAATREHRLCLVAQLAKEQGMHGVSRAKMQRLQEEIGALQAHEEQLEEQLFLADPQNKRD